MADRIKVFGLGGLDEKGRDCYIVEINDDIFVLDAGISIPDKRYPGADCLLPNFGYLIKNKNRIKAYILSHGHDENVGAIKYIYKFAPAPIYCTDTTRIVVDGQMLMHHTVTKMDYRIIKPNDDVVIANRKVRFFQTCHNAANSCGVAISTDQGNIVYTSDFIISFATDEPNYKFDLAKTSQIALEKTYLLITESNGASKDGYCSPKHRINDLLENKFKADKRIFVTCYWQNMYRIRELIKLAKKYNKKIYCYDDYTRQIMRNVIIAGNGAPLTENDLVKKEDFLRIKRNDLFVLILGDNDDIFEEIKALSDGNNADSRIVVDKNDIFVNAAVPRASYETFCTRAVDSMYRTGCDVLWLKNKHVSAMHAREDDLRFIINLFKPQYYLPVRGNFIDIMQNAKHSISLGTGLNYSNVFVMDNGMELILEPGKRPVVVPQEASGIEISPILVDGKGISKTAEDIIEMRQRMGEDGVVVIAALVSLSKKKIVAGPDCQMRGFVFVKEAEPLLKFLNQLFIDEINAGLISGVSDFSPIRQIIKDKAKRFIKKENGREPYIDPIILIQE